MKIGIYTFFRGNYGAILQAYSLQKTVNELFPDSEVQIVDFKTEKIEKLEKIFRFRSANPFKNVIWLICTLFRYRQIKKKTDSFIDFKRRFNYTSRYSSTSELLNNPPLLDVHLTGSDQVFNPNRKYRDVYYLNFKKGNARKIAYAPSFGVNQFSDEDKQYIKKMLTDFDVLSCRETDGAQQMSSIIGKTIPQVLDPVFLTSVEDWRSMETKPRINNKYVLVYSLKNTKISLDFAKKHYPDHTIVLLSPNDLRFYSGCEHIYYPGPCDFIGLIDNAEAIVTDSFHGTAFSIIFEKEFKTIITRPEVSSRIVSLLNSLGLEDHILCPYGKSSNNTSISYKPVLDQMISDSKQFLSQSIHGDFK
jgi:hypothetical protein